MKQLFIFFVSVYLLSACQTRELMVTNAPGEINYIDLHDIAVNAGHSQALDFDGDKKPDLLVGTMLVKNDMQQEADLQFLAVSRTNSYLLLDNQNDADRNSTPILNAGMIIDSKPPDGFHWVNIASVILSKKIMPENKAVQWNGSYKDAHHHFLPFQLKNPHGNYYGWLEITMNTSSETMTLHRAGISKEPGKIIKTGR